MHLTELTKVSVTAMLAVVLSGCASIVDGGPRKMSINSDPSGASVRIVNKKGVEVANQLTPTIVPLKRGGSYTTARYTVEVSKAGYQTASFEIKSTLNGWYFGNILFGGLLGMLIVDPLTGAMWTLTPRDINAALQKSGTPTTQVIQKDGGLIVMLRQDIPSEFASKLISLKN